MCAASESEMEIDTSELLEEMLHRAENAVFPTLRKATERFIDIVNHPRVQARMQSKLEEINSKIEDMKACVITCENAVTVYDFFFRMRRFFDVVQSTADPTYVMTALQRTGLLGLLDDKEFEFLSKDDISESHRVDQFLKIIDEKDAAGTGKSGEAFEQYIESWRQNRRRLGYKAADIQSQINEK